MTDTTGEKCLTVKMASVSDADAADKAQYNKFVKEVKSQHDVPRAATEPLQSRCRAPKL